jgi:predicted anti-sigma-YlaC factor YlaD
MKEHLIAGDLLALAAAGLLDPTDQERVDDHLRNCEICRAEFDGWTRLACALKELPTPQAPPKMVSQTQRLLRHAAAMRQNQRSRFGLVLLVLFSWMITFVTFGFVWLLDIPLARWLDVSSKTVWVAYIGSTWLATALATGLLGKRWQQEGRTI